MFLISVFICFCIASAINYFKTRRQRLHITNLKGPFTFPLVGSLHKLILINPKNFQNKSVKYFDEFGTFSRCWIFHRLLILTADYELVVQLLNKETHLNTGYRLLRPWLGGNGLLMLDDQEWLQRRQLISHNAFHKTFLQEFIEIFDLHAKILIERLKERSVNDAHTTFDISMYTEKFILDTMIDATLGIKGRAQYDNSIEFAKWIADLTTHFTDRFLCLHSANNITYTIMCPLKIRHQNRLIKSINKFLKEIINERRHGGAQRNCATKSKDNFNLQTNIYTIQMTNDNCENVAATEMPINFLDILLKATIEQRSLNDNEIIDELNTFLFQGYLLLTSALNFTLINLARFPTVQRKTFEELQREIGDAAFIDNEKLQRLVYMENVIKETLRLYPALPIIGRELTKPFEYSHTAVSNGTLPIGSEIYINLFEMLRDENKFKDPTNFKPERFETDENNSNNNNLLFFSMGPRNCIAQKFTNLLLKTVLVHILRQFEILPLGNEVRLEFKIVLTSSNGFQIGLQAR